MNLSKLLTIIGAMIILLGIVIIALKKIEENRCYNLPLNEYVEDKSCMKLNEG